MAEAHDASTTNAELVVKMKRQLADVRDRGFTRSQ
jgi:hypothetical protein